MPPVVFELLIFAAMALILITQVIVPAITSAPLFPIFRLKHQVRSVEDARRDLQAARLESDASRDRIIAHRIRNAIQKEENRAWESEKTGESQAASAVADTAEQRQAGDQE